MGTPLSYAAGGAASGLEELLKQRFFEQFQKMKLADDVERTRIAKQSADDNSEYRRMQQTSLDDARSSAADAKRQVGASRIASNLTPDSKIDPSTLQALVDGGLGSLVQHKDATLGSTNLSGVASSAGAAPKILRLMKTANPGQDASDTFTGTASQLAEEQARKDALEAREQARHDKDDAATMARENQEHLLRLAASLRPPKESRDRFNVVQGVDGAGKPAIIRTNLDSGTIDVIPMPQGAAPKQAGPHQKTPAEIEAEAAARARGTATGKKDAGGGGVLDAIASVFSKGEKPATPHGMIRARDEHGKLHEAPAGTPLPPGWKLEG